MGMIVMCFHDRLVTNSQEQDRIQCMIDTTSTMSSKDIMDRLVGGLVCGLV